MLTQKDYCDYETCVALKEVGCDQHYDRYKETNDKGEFIFDWFTLYEAQKWLREMKGIIVYPQYLTNGQTWMCMVYEEKKMFMHSFGRGSYNEVLNEGIKEAVKILKEK